MPLACRLLFSPGVEPRNIWVILGILIVIALLFAALMPLPGQRDDTTPLVEPAPGGSISPAPPTGPSEQRSSAGRPEK